MNETLPGVQTFVDNLSNVKKARPQVEPYPKISEALGQAIVGVLLGKAQPGAALDQAARHRTRPSPGADGEPCARTLDTAPPAHAAVCARRCAGPGSRAPDRVGVRDARPPC